MANATSTGSSEPRKQANRRVRLCIVVVIAAQAILVLAVALFPPLRVLNLNSRTSMKMAEGEALRGAMPARERGRSVRSHTLASTHPRPASDIYSHSRTTSTVAAVMIGARGNTSLPGNYPPHSLPVPFTASGTVPAPVSSRPPPQFQFHCMPMDGDPCTDDDRLRGPPRHLMQPGRLSSEDERMLHEARQLAGQREAAADEVPPAKRKVAFLFLSKGPLPLAPLWERFLQVGEEGGMQMQCMVREVGSIRSSAW